MARADYLLRAAPLVPGEFGLRAARQAAVELRVPGVLRAIARKTPTAPYVRMARPQPIRMNAIARIAPSLQ